MKQYWKAGHPNLAQHIETLGPAVPINFAQGPHSNNQSSGFELMTIPQVQEALVQEGLFKPNCAVVMLDFLIRHGFVTPDNTPDYVDIVTQLHNDLSYDC